MYHRIVEQLKEVKLPGVFNPYTDQCDVYDTDHSPELRCRNLSNLIEAAARGGVDAIWFGRDLGYMGGRRTGIALTDELHLSFYEAMFPGLKLAKATRGGIVGEKTAKMLWEVLAGIECKIFLWNIFPLHPHEENFPHSNRCHSKSERAATQFVLDELISLLSPKRLIAIGNDAARGLAEMGHAAVKIRHPSYGGKADFVRGLASIYGISNPSFPENLF